MPGPTSQARPSPAGWLGPAARMPPRRSPTDRPTRRRSPAGRPPSRAQPGGGNALKDSLKVEIPYKLGLERSGRVRLHPYWYGLFRGTSPFVLDPLHGRRAPQVIWTAG